MEGLVLIMYPSLMTISEMRYGMLFAGIQPPTFEEIPKYVTVDRIKMEIPEDRTELLEDLFRRYNDPENNPLSQSDKQKLIRDSGTYTSMSMGSIIEVNLPNGTTEYWTPSRVGWKEICNPTAVAVAVAVATDK